MCNSHCIFMLACLPTRLALAYWVYTGTYPTHIVAGVLSLVGLSFMTLYLTNSRLHAVEGGGTTWWHHLRPFHGALYLVAGCTLALGYQDVAGLVLALDAAIGLLASIDRYYR